jgi:hypothetical protein
MVYLAVARLSPDQFVSFDKVIGNNRGAVSVRRFKGVVRLLC